MRHFNLEQLFENEIVPYSKEGNFEIVSDESPDDHIRQRWNRQYIPEDEALDSINVSDESTIVEKRKNMLGKLAADAVIRCKNEGTQYVYVNNMAEMIFVAEQLLDGPYERTEASSFEDKMGYPGMRGVAVSGLDTREDVGHYGHKQWTILVKIDMNSYRPTTINKNYSEEKFF